jgi:hypothetical protein
MSKAPKKKQARQLTTDEAMDRLFGKDAAQKLREVVEQEDAQKGQRKPKKAND